VKDLKVAEAVPMLFILLIIIPALTSTVTAQTMNESCSYLRHLLNEEFRKAYTLSVEGLNTSQVIKDLDKAVKLMDSGKCREASELLSKASQELKVMSSSAGAEVMRKEAVKWSTVAVLASLPVITYLLLPRAYLRLWFRYRKKWRVRKP
jgi:hypothetical protein